MKYALVIDAEMLKPGENGGALRLFYLMQLLREFGCAVSFAPANLLADPPNETLLRDAGIEVLARPTIDSLEEYLQACGARYDLVILSRVSVATKFMGAVRTRAPRARVLFDTMDLQFLREFREAKLTNNVLRLQRALMLKQQELAAARTADCTIVVSSVEQAMLQQAAPEIKTHLISNIHPLHNSTPPFSTRRDILFIGEFNHNPNVDAMLYFVQEIFPLIRAQHLGIKLYIIGGHPPEAVQTLSADDVRVTGYVSDIETYFNRCKLSVAPLRFGAGVKGKVLTSLSYGVPVVGTSIAMEGLSIINGCDGLIADEPRDLAEAVIRLYCDEALWNTLSRNGLSKVEQHFSFETARAQLGDLLASLQS